MLSYVCDSWFGRVGDVGFEGENAQVDQDLPRPGLRDIQLLYLGGDGAGLVVDGGLVLLGDLDVGHGGSCFLEFDCSVLEHFVNATS